jgi:hypothetical protein
LKQIPIDEAKMLTKWKLLGNICSVICLKEIYHDIYIVLENFGLRGDGVIDYLHPKSLECKCVIDNYHRNQNKTCFR